MNKIIEQLRDVNNKIKDIEQRKAEPKTGQLILSLVEKY